MVLIITPGQAAEVRTIRDNEEAGSPYLNFSNLHFLICEMGRRIPSPPSQVGCVTTYYIIKGSATKRFLYNICRIRHRLLK